MRFKDLANSTIGILGLGREGQAVWRQLRQRFPSKELHFFAESEAGDGFQESLSPELDFCHFGPLKAEKLKQFDVLIRSAGISPYRGELQKLRELGVQFTTANSLWFAEHPQAKTICISGTKGKSTTAALTAHLLNDAGLKACLCGNIGRPMLDCDDGAVDWWVIELSSYQISDLEAQPTVVMLLNLSDEHVDWHGGADRYRSDKLKLASLSAQSPLIANHADAGLVDGLKGVGNVVWFNGNEGWKVNNGEIIFQPEGNGTDEIALDEVALNEAAGLNKNNRVVSAPDALPGEHNLHNLAAILTLLDTLKVTVPDLDGSLAAFSGLPHRLQFLGENDGVMFVDDSISTTPVSVVAALETIGTDKLVLLLGGLDRGLEWDDFATDLVGSEPYAIITMPDNGPGILASLNKAGVKPDGGLHAVTDLSQAVELARLLVPAGGTVLLSPGAPSFPHFRDFEDRGDQFANFAGLTINRR